MTTVLTPQDVARIVQRVGLPDLLRRLVSYLEADYLRWAEFDKTPRVAAHSPDGVIELMPIADASLYSFKYVNGHPKNHRFGLPTVMAFGVLADVDTGAPVLLSELTLTTAMRTAATSVMVAKQLARPDSRVMALIGNGAQSEFQALAFHHLLGIRELRLFDIDPAATQKLVRHLSGTPGLTLTVCRSTAEAVQGADIITTVTADKANATIITPDMIRPGQHINGVGGDCPGKTELHPGVLTAARVIVEYEPQSRIEGEIQQLDPSFTVVELADVVSGRAHVRTSDRDVTIFDSVGFALEDFSALRFLHALNRAEAGDRPQLDLVPRLADPKDLYSALRVAPAPAAAATALAARVPPRRAEALRDGPHRSAEVA